MSNLDTFVTIKPFHLCMSPFTLPRSPMIGTFLFSSSPSENNCSDSTFSKGGIFCTERKNKKKCVYSPSIISYYFSFFFGRIIHTLIPNSKIQNVLCLWVNSVHFLPSSPHCILFKVLTLSFCKSNSILTYRLLRSKKRVTQKALDLKTSKSY